MQESEYVNRFLNLRCSGDVLNATGKLGKHSEKEITEAMAIIRVIKPLTLSKPMHYKLIDFCSGNCLIPILAVHLLPIKESIAIDIRPAKKKYNMVNRFHYRKISLYDDIFDDVTYPIIFKDDYIITSCHACGSLAERVVEIYNKQLNFKHLALMPCCIGKHEKIKLPEVFGKKMGKYLEWCHALYSIVEADKKGAIEDSRCLSPCNCIIKASKKEI